MIARETIDRIRERASILDVVGEHVKLTRRGRSHTGLCPFHKEKTPSFHVSEERGRYHCFGCNAGGDVVGFLVEIEGLTFLEAVKRLAERTGVEIEETLSDEDRRRHADARRRSEDLHAVCESAARYFESMLERHPLSSISRDELAKRGLRSAAPGDQVASALAAFRVGYAPYGWEGLTQHLRAEGYSPLVAESAGLSVPRREGSSHYDRFRHRLMFAITDPSGRVVAFSGRTLPEPAPEHLASLRLGAMGGAESSAAAKYVNSPESPIYRKRELVFGLHQAKAAIRESGEAIVVEGNFDVLGLHARGLRNVVAPLGTAFTVEQARQLKRHTQRVVLLFDGDAAGRRATAAAREPCREAGVDARAAVLPAGTDPDELARQAGIRAITLCVAASKSLLEHLIDAALDGSFLGEGAVARAARLEEVSRLIASEQDPTVRVLAESYADHVAERLGVADARTLRALSAAIRKGLHGVPEPTGAPAGVVPPPERARSRSRSSDIRREILGSILDFPTLVDDPEISEELTWLDGSLAVAIAALRHVLDGSGAQESADFAEQLLAKLPTPIHSFAAARLAAPKHEQIQQARRELLENLKKLKRLEQSRQTSELLVELERSQSTGDFEQQMKLLTEQSRRARSRHGL